MPLPSAPEQFCTLFDQNFLPMGLTLYRSLLTHAQPCHLWILCMDQEVEHQLRQLNLPQVSLIPLREIETPALLAVKPDRSRGEYCWTLTPFTFTAIFRRDRSIQRVTYVDADLWFLNSPRLLLQELDASGKSILITEHAYAPEYESALEYGRFCVQFLSVCNTPAALEVMDWWQQRCLEWCFQRLEAGKFGDQKYLDCWPERFGAVVHILQQTEQTLAPWNVQFIAHKLGNQLAPVFFHFHLFRIISPTQVQLYTRYRIGRAGLKIYHAYFAAILESLRLLRSHDIPIPCLPPTPEAFARLRRWKRQLQRTLQFRSIPKL